MRGVRLIEFAVRAAFTARWPRPLSALTRP